MVKAESFEKAVALSLANINPVNKLGEPIEVPFCSAEYLAHTKNYDGCDSNFYWFSGEA